MVNLIQIADGSFGLQGKALDTGAFVFINIPYSSSSPLAMSSFVASRDVVVQYIVAVPDVVSTNAVTATVYKAFSGTAIGSGTALHSGTINLQGTAGANQGLLPTTGGVNAVAAGSRVGVVISGAIGAAGSGVITVACTVL